MLMEFFTIKLVSLWVPQTPCITLYCTKNIFSWIYGWHGLISVKKYILCDFSSFLVLTRWDICTWSPVLVEVRDSRILVSGIFPSSHWVPLLGEYVIVFTMLNMHWSSVQSEHMQCYLQQHLSIKCGEGCRNIWCGSSISYRIGAIYLVFFAPICVFMFVFF